MKVYHTEREVISYFYETPLGELPVPELLVAAARAPGALPLLLTGAAALVYTEASQLGEELAKSTAEYAAESTVSVVQGVATEAHNMVRPQRRQKGMGYYKTPPRKRRKFIPSAATTRYRVGGAKFLSSTEKKFYDTAHAFSSAATAAWDVGATSPVLTLAQGTGASQRVGKYVFISALTLQGEIRMVGNTQSNKDGHCKLKLMLDTQANGSMATESEVFEDSAEFNSFNNLDNSSRFRTIHAWDVVLPVRSLRHTGTAYVDSRYPLFYHKEWKTPLKITYNSTAGAITEISQNNLFFVFASDDGTAAATSFDFETRIRYTD